MKINIEQLLTISNYAKLKDLSRQHIYRLIEKKELTLIEIDSVKFILLDDKAIELCRKRHKQN